MARTDTLGNFLTDVADAIRTKTGSSDTIQASDFDTAIENIPTGGASEYFNEVQSTDTMTYWARDNYIKKVPDTLTIPNNITSISYLFSDFKVKTPNAPKIISGSQVTQFGYLFEGSLFQNIDLSGVDTTNIGNPINMFYNCSELVSVNLGNFNPTGTNASSMFANCKKLISIDLSHYDKILTSIGNMFQYCNVLQFLDIRKLVFSNIAVSWASTTFQGIPANCLIIVKDQTEKNWLLSVRSDFTNVQTVEEYEASLNS